MHRGNCRLRAQSSPWTGSLRPPGRQSCCAQPWGWVWGLSPCPGHTLAVHCLTPGQPALTGAATLIRLSDKSAECPRSPGALPGLAVPKTPQEPARTWAQPHRSPALGMFCTEGSAQTHESLAQTISEQNKSKLGADYGIPRAAPTPSLYPSLPGH